MKLNSFKIRSSLWGTAALAITSVLFCMTSGCGQDKTDTDNLVLEESTTWATTSTVMTSSTSTSTTTTTTVETTLVSTTTQMATVPQSTAPIEEEIVYEATYTELELPITNQEFILIANVLSHEAGSSWISEYERTCIVACIMNRTSDSRFPDTIDEVVHQPYQMFDVPYYRIDYSGIGYEPIDNAIYAYFNGTYDCGSINSWSGDGEHNLFYYQ